MTPVWRSAAILVLALAAASPAAAQIADPKTAFVQALVRLTRVLEGSYGDEGATVVASLDAMEHGLTTWDAAVRDYEVTTAAERNGTATRETAAARAALGAIYLDRSRVDDALREFAGATELDPTRADAYAMQGLAYSQLLHAADKAAAAFRQAAVLAPRDSPRAYVLGRQLLALGDVEGARRAFRDFVEADQKQQRSEPRRAGLDTPFIRLSPIQEPAGIEPFFAPVPYAEGFTRLFQGDYAQAIVELRKAAAGDPLVVERGADAAALDRATTAFRDGSIETAVAALKSAIELAPDHSEPHRILGLVYIANGQHDLGGEELRSAIRLNPANERARLALAEMLANTRQYEAAGKVLQETIAAQPASGLAHYKLALLYRWQGVDAQALPEFEKARSFNPIVGSNGLYQTIGSLYAVQYKLPSAIEAYSRRVDLYPNDPEAHRDLGDTYFRDGQDDEALAELTVALLLNPQLAAASAGVAQVHLRAGRFAECAVAAERALELDPTLTQARYAFATALLRLGRTDQGRLELEKYERQQADATAARSRKLKLDGLKREAALSTAKGDRENVVRLLREALDYERNVAAAHYTLGVALLETGQPAEAVERFKSAELLDDHFDVHRRLAEAYAALGQRDQSGREQAVYERMKRESLRQAGANR